MAYYVDRSSQTTIAGLTKHPLAFPPVLSYTDATTPPDDMPSKQLQLATHGTPAITKTAIADQNTSPSRLLRRKRRPPLVARISRQALEVDAEGPRSPPPTETVLSPLPAANTLHAGHTPIFPRSLSPLHDQEDNSGPSTPEQEGVLTGPLTLPAQPGHGLDDRIELRVLDAELEKIAKEQGISPLRNGPRSTHSQHAENGGQSSLKGSGENRRRPSADDAEVVDGVILKKPRMNLGAPLGQV
ncbi:uncharacterized protein BDR25DRAFT_390040 [Lindgomyces ingoldianus]|uniref:Uncharacterized protein n=1 Tax=Lindgomyces ingoldianus TaxID=673940 RepID=A0ACB6RF86_9PLEO|nr:uncharacterized protein BDR25DRAFT_390040 [Lindgomyces ingoldianus]KAF2477385.1 hypothetical protein BDR25DRAFT_390040 [Lindgomyces ingoldianus]